MTPNEYAKNSENYLPSEISDFHDQKDLFKTFEDIWGENETYDKMPNSWVDNHVFTIDFLLFFFAMHGYKLQKIKKKGVEFYDLGQTIEYYTKIRNGRSADILSEALAKVGKTTQK